jgi:outer membrane receptor protein involved in Fe transport
VGRSNAGRAIRRTATSILTLAIAAIPLAAVAQTEEQQVDAQAQKGEEVGTASAPNEAPAVGAPESDAIVVTGSRIARPNIDTNEPIVVVNSEQIEARGFETLGQALNELPAFGVPGSSPVGAQSSFGPGQNFVNFLGLGSERTLVIVNGRRFVGSNTASIFGPTGQGGNQVDLNMIPTKLVDRVETIVIGGAPIYGSDAIAGTVNIIMKRNYEGLELDAQYGISERGDAPNYRFRALAGKNFADGRGNIAIAGEYNESAGLVAFDRPRLFDRAFAVPNDPNSEFGNELISDPRYVASSEFGIPTIFDFFPLSPELSAGLIDPDFPLAVFTNAAGRPLRFDQSGNLIELDFGRLTGAIDPATGLPTAFEGVQSGGNAVDLFQFVNVLTDTKRYSGVVTGNFQVTDSIRVFGEGWFSHSEGVNLRAQPEYNEYFFDVAGTPAGAFELSVNNPFLNPQARAIIQAQAEGDTFFLNRANADLSTGRATGEVDVYRFVAGLDGKFNVGTREWTFEVVGNYGRSETNGASPVLVTQNLFNALDAVQDASGAIVCRPGFQSAPIETVSSTCAPLNPFGQQASDAARDYVTAIARPNSVNEQKVGTVSLTGGLFDLPGGVLNFAVGYEHREESQNFDPGAFYSGGPDPDLTEDADENGDPTDDRVAFGQSAIILPVNGRYNTDEVFGELRVPLIGADNNVPLIRTLELQAAARYVDHSVAGGDLTWTVGGSWQPIRDISFRGNYTRAIRSPFITEAFNPSSTFFQFAEDPCDQGNLENGPAPATRQANCAAAGIPANFNAVSDDFSFLQAVAGNPGLSNEKSDAFSIGAVLRPSFIPRLNITVDYVDIKVKDVITQFTGTDIAEACYDAEDFPDNEFCNRLERDFSLPPGDPDFGQITFIESGYFNAASLRYKGVLAAIDYRVPTPFLGADSTIGFNGSYQYLDTLTSRASAESAPTTTGGSIGYSRHQGAASVSYNNKGFGAFAQFNYYGGAAFDPDESETFRTPNRVGDVVFTNVGLSYELNKRFAVRMVVDNVFDTKPPFPSPTGGGTVTYFSGVLGRYFRFGATLGF